VRHGTFRPVGTLVIAVLALSACGGGGGGTEASGSPLPTCSGSPVANTGLPSDFPVPEAVTFTKASTLGPSRVADGFATETVEKMYNEWKDIMGQVHYTILLSEAEIPNDAEISYKTADGKNTGQVALRNDCGGGDKIAVHVTNRPA
jgi:hypothetical protein